MTNKPNSTENLEVFLLLVFHFCIRLGFGGYFLLDGIFLVYVFSWTKEILFLNFALGARAQ